MILINSSPKDALRIFQPFLPIFVPIGIGYLMAVAEQRGIKARIIDEQIEDDILTEVAEHVRGMEKPYIFGFSVLTAALKNALVTAERLKAVYPDSIICFGGIHPTAAPEEVLSYRHVDYVLRGEGEESLFELYRCIREGRDVLHIKGLSYRLNGQIIHNERLPLLANLDILPPFPYHLFRHRRYDLGFVVSSRGCPHRCIFCSNRITTGRRYRVRSSEAIINDIEMLYYRYGRRYILFLDDNLLVNRERVYLLLDEIKSRGFDKKMTFNFQARADNVNRRLLQDLYGAGFRSVFFGLETASEDIMKTIKKNETVAQCIDAVRMAKETGFHVSATFIYALPGEKHKDRMACVKLSKELGIDMVRFNNATPYPGTELFEIAKRENRLNIKGLYENFNSVSTFIENPFRKIPFSYVPEGNTEDEIRRDILFSYFSYYLDAKRLKGIFARPDLGAGWFNAGERLIEIIRKMPALFFLGLMLCLKFGQLMYYMVFKKETSSLLRRFPRQK